jgi:glycogen synthase
MKICLISEEFPPETGWGGIGTHTYNLSLALAGAGHEVHVLTKSVDGREHSTNTEGLSIHRIPEPRRFASTVLTAAAAAGGAEFLADAGEYPLRSLRRGEAVSAWLRRNGPFDVVEAPDYGAETFVHQLPGQTQAPVVVKLHTPLYLNQRLNGVPRDTLPVKARKWMEQYCITRAARVISPTRSLAEIIRQELGVEGIEVVPNCIDTDFFTFREKTDARESMRFLYAGRLERRKGVEVLARAIPPVLRILPGAMFRFVGRDTPTAEGGGSMLEWLKRHFDREGVSERVEFTGEVPRAEIVPRYQDADACILPSLWENLPYTCLESMATGTPVLASRAGGFPEIITDGVDGMLFEPGNHEDLADKIIRIAAPGTAAELGRHARDTVERRYGHRTIADRTVELYRSVSHA